MQKGVPRGRFAVAQKVAGNVRVRAHKLVERAHMIFRGHGVRHGGRGVKFFGEREEERSVLKSKFAYHTAIVAGRARFVNGARDKMLFHKVDILSRR